MIDIADYIARREQELGFTSPFNHNDNAPIPVVKRDYWQEGLNEEYQRANDLQDLINLGKQ